MKNFKLIGILFLILIGYSSCNLYLINPNPQFSGWSSFLETGEIQISEKANSIKSVKSGTYIYRKFFPETTTLTHYIEFSDFNLKVRDGTYKEYTDQGILMTTGKYKENEKNGDWIGYDPWTGKLKYSGTYIDNNKVGIWYEYNIKTGLVKEERIYPASNSSDSLATFIRYDSTSTKIIKEGLLHGDSLFSISFIDSAYLNLMEVPESGVQLLVEKMPLFMCIENEDSAEVAMLKHIYSKIKYPKDARSDDIEGKAIITFTIDTIGQVRDVKTYRGVCESIKNECLRIVKEMPNWCPGVYKGREVEVLYNLPIRFKLE